MAGDTRFAEALKYERSLKHWRGPAINHELQAAFIQALGEANMSQFMADCSINGQPWNDVFIRCRNISPERNNTILASMAVQKLTAHTQDDELIRSKHEFSMHLYYVPEHQKRKIITCDVSLLDDVRNIVKYLSDHIDAQIDKLTKELETRELNSLQSDCIAQDLKWFWVCRLGLNDY